jgi:DNA-binding NarL/FixJ family response regulator
MKANKSNRPAVDPRRGRVFVVDDHPLIRQGLAGVIADAGDLEFCGEASSAADALARVAALEPSLVIVDISLRDRDGLDLIKDLKARHPDLRMLVSSMHEESLYAERALRAGARGYIDKGADSEELQAAMRAVLKGELYVSKAIAARMLQRLTSGGGDIRATPMEKLSDRELSVFTLVGQGLSTREIAERLFLSVKTIETHKEHLKVKLNLRSANELIMHALQWQMKNN